MFSSSLSSLAIAVGAALLLLLADGTLASSSSSVTSSGWYVGSFSMLNDEREASIGAEDAEVEAKA